VDLYLEVPVRSLSEGDHTLLVRAIRAAKSSRSRSSTFHVEKECSRMALSNYTYHSRAIGFDGKITEPEQVDIPNHGLREWVDRTDPGSDPATELRSVQRVFDPEARWRPYLGHRASGGQRRLFPHGNHFRSAKPGRGGRRIHSRPDPPGHGDDVQPCMARKRPAVEQARARIACRLHHRKRQDHGRAGGYLQSPAGAFLLLGGSAKVFSRPHPRSKVEDEIARQ